MHAIMSAIRARRRERGASAPIRQGAAIRASRYAHAGAEPPLEEVLADPIVHLMVQADRLELAVVRRMLIATQRGLN
jgi:hypothetical protein